MKDANRNENELNIHDDRVTNKISITLGSFSIDAEGQPALTMANIIEKNFPELIKVLKSKNWQDLTKSLSPLIEPFLSQLVEKWCKPQAEASEPTVDIPPSSPESHPQEAHDTIHKAPLDSPHK